MGRVKALYASYRSWADTLFASVEPLAVWTKIRRESDLSSISSDDFDILFFVGWSGILPESMVRSNKCVCLHPSPLPKYRGGSPIQHQIINGETKGAVTLFIMNTEIDAGPILYQEEINLGGELGVIFSRIAAVGGTGIAKVIEKYSETGLLKGEAQNHSEATFYKRRKEEESEITLDEISTKSAKYLYNKIRSLQDPYPNAFIRCSDGSKLYITRSHYGN